MDFDWYRMGNEEEWPTTARSMILDYARTCGPLALNLFRHYGRPRRYTREEYRKMYPYRGLIGPPMKCAADVIRTLEGLMESASQNSKASSRTKEMGALAAEVLGEVALYMLTTHTGTASSEVSFARLVTRHFERFGMTPESLRRLLNIFEASRQLNSWDESK